MQAWHDLAVLWLGFSLGVIVTGVTMLMAFRYDLQRNKHQRKKKKGHD